MTLYLVDSVSLSGCGSWTLHGAFYKFRVRGCLSYRSIPQFELQLPNALVLEHLGDRNGSICFGEVYDYWLLVPFGSNSCAEEFIADPKA